MMFASSTLTTDEDITRLILTQIIVEDAKTPDSNFPLDVLAPDGDCLGEGQPGKRPQVY